MTQKNPERRGIHGGFHLCTVLLIFLALLGSLKTAVCAGPAGCVTTVGEAFGGSHSVYVAGNPNGYPVEYYNKDTKQFEGIMPRLLERAAEETGLSFTYIRGGERDQRARIAANGQAEMVSCVEVSDTELLSALREKSPVLFTVRQEDGEHAYCMGYTVIAAPELVQQVNAVLQEVSAEELVSISVAAAGGYGNRDTYPVVNAAIGGFVVLLLVLAVVAIVFLCRSRKGQKNVEEQTKSNGLMTPDAFREYFDISLNEQVRPAFVMAFISFDTETVAHTYGVSGIGRQFSMAGRELLDFKDPDDLVVMDSLGLVMLKISGGDENTEEWITRVLKKLNGDIERSSSSYYRAGIYHLTRTDNSCEEAIFNARQSFLAAERAGKDFQFCTEELLHKIAEHRQLAKDAEKGLNNKEFKLYLQLTVESGTHKVKGAEALTRWEHPKRGLLHPGLFIAALTETGIIHKLDYYIFEEVCSQLAEWQKQGIHQDCYISCNFTRNTIDSPGFPDEIRTRAEKYVFDHSKLVLEITEEAFELNRLQALNNISECRNAGFRIALDDLGSGVTSFADLRDYPLDMIKIDGSILQKADTQRGRALLGAIIHMGQELKLKTLCEGVETVEQVTMLETLDCCLMQGYYFYRPMPASVVQQYLGEA